jgi:antitoxin MazE
MHATVRKWGNSLALRIPHTLAKDLPLHQGDVVELGILKGKMVVKPKGQKKYSLAELLKKINRRNLHSEQDTGYATGKEAW